MHFVKILVREMATDGRQLPESMLRDEHAPETTDGEGIVDSIIDGELARALSELPDQTAHCRRHAA